MVTGPRAAFRLQAQPDLADRVVDRIQQMVIDGELREGEVLPPEIELAELMGVSRTALREAKRTLAARGVLESRQGVGTAVRSIDAGSIAEPMQLYSQIRLGGVDFESFHQVRNLLEIEIAGLGAEQASPEQLIELDALMSAMRASVDDGDRFSRADADFHQQLARMSGNPVLELLGAVIRDLLQRHIRDVITAIDPSVDVLPFHQAILDAVSARDRARARDTMDAHLEQVRANWVQARTGHDIDHA